MLKRLAPKTAVAALVLSIVAVTASANEKGVETLTDVDLSSLSLGLVKGEL